MPPAILLIGIHFSVGCGFERTERRAGMANVVE